MYYSIFNRSSSHIEENTKKKKGKKTHHSYNRIFICLHYIKSILIYFFSKGRKMTVFRYEEKFDHSRRIASGLLCLIAFGFTMIGLCTSLVNKHLYIFHWKQRNKFDFSFFQFMDNKWIYSRRWSSMAWSVLQM